MGENLQHYIDNHLVKLDSENINKIGIQLLKIIKDLHSIGYIYNDLKPDNICVGALGTSCRKLQMIDFGLCTKFLSRDGKHIEQCNSSFIGNLLFCSPNILEKKITSRRDDLISLYYLLVYLSSPSQYPFEIYDIPFADNVSQQLKMKKSISLRALSKITDT